MFTTRGPRLGFASVALLAIGCSALPAVPFREVSELRDGPFRGRREDVSSDPAQASAGRATDSFRTPRDARPAAFAAITAIRGRFGLRRTAEMTDGRFDAIDTGDGPRRPTPAERDAAAARPLELEARAVTAGGGHVRITFGLSADGCYFVQVESDLRQPQRDALFRTVRDATAAFD